MAPDTITIDGWLVSDDGNEVMAVNTDARWLLRVTSFATGVGFHITDAEGSAHSATFALEGLRDALAELSCL